MAAFGRILPLLTGSYGSAESGRPSEQWTFHAAFLKVGEEQSNEEKRCCKPLF